MQSIDHLESAEAAGADARGQIARLIETLSIAARGAEWSVLNRIHAAAVLNVVVGMVEYIERLRAESQHVTFTQSELARDSQVDLLGPWAVERVQAGERAGTSSVDAECGVRCALKGCSVVDRVLQSAIRTAVGNFIGCAGQVDQGGIGTARGKLRHRADAPVR